MSIHPQASAAGCNSGESDVFAWPAMRHPAGRLQCKRGSCPVLTDRHHLGSVRLLRGWNRIRFLALIPTAYLCLQQVRGPEISVISAILARSIRTGQPFGAAGQSSTGSGGSAGSFGHGVHPVQRGLVADPCTWGASRWLRTMPLIPSFI